MLATYLSYFIGEQTPAYGGMEGLVQLKANRSITNGDTTNEMSLFLPNHIGTHIDFPFHFSKISKN